MAYCQSKDSCTKSSDTLVQSGSAHPPNIIIKVVWPKISELIRRDKVGELWWKEPELADGIVLATDAELQQPGNVSRCLVKHSSGDCGLANYLPCCNQMLGPPTVSSTLRRANVPSSDPTAFPIQNEATCLQCLIGVLRRSSTLPADAFGSDHNMASSSCSCAIR